MISTEDVLRSIRDSLAAITAPRFFDTERGYQGALLGHLEGRLQLPDYAIVEQEYQKQAGLHGLTIRPDIIIHEPFDSERHCARTDGNLAVVELKLRARPAEALGDFQSIRLMLDTLQYPIGVFINIGSTLTYAESLPEHIRERVVCFAVVLVNGAVQLTEGGAYRGPVARATR